jgi:hypothetical protein
MASRPAFEYFVTKSNQVLLNGYTVTGEIELKSTTL